MTREICKLVKESPPRSYSLEEMRKTTKDQAKIGHSFCPARWTVHGETLDSIINNHDQLMSLWEWSLQELSNTKMKARIYGASLHLKKFIFSSCRLGATILNQIDNFLILYKNLHCLLLKVLI